jgi:hypothetical protein
MTATTFNEAVVGAHLGHSVKVSFRRLRTPVTCGWVAPMCASTSASLSNAP